MLANNDRVRFFCEAGEFCPRKDGDRDALVNEAAQMCEPQRVWSIFNTFFNKKPAECFWQGDMFTVFTSTPDRVRFKDFLKVSRHIDFTVDHPTDIRVLVLFAKSTSARRFAH